MSAATHQSVSVDVGVVVECLCVVVECVGVGFVDVVVPVVVISVGGK